VQKDATRFPDESAGCQPGRNDGLDQDSVPRRAMATVAAAGRDLRPGGRVEEDHVFHAMGGDGKPVKVRLSELFTPGRETLIVYDLKVPGCLNDERRPAGEETAKPDREEASGPSCVAFFDALDAAVERLEATGYNFAVIATAPLDRLIAFGKERGWRHLRLLSAAGSNFTRDYHGQASEGVQMPMMTIFHRKPDGIEHFWSSEGLNLDPDIG
jgi:predicted dithiol-disulfide oxidoreductase (DUF899 family)